MCQTLISDILINMAKGLHIKIDQIEILIEGNMFDHDCFVSKILVFVPCIFDLLQYLSVSIGTFAELALWFLNLTELSSSLKLGICLCASVRVCCNHLFELTIFFVSCSRMRVQNLKSIGNV
jgi:hypothetical protein